jgi:hypothetical protein
MEFQSRPDPSMPVRFMGYESLFYQRLMAGQPAADWRKLPPVIPVLVYNGWEPWNVATDLGSLIGDLDPSDCLGRKPPHSPWRSSKPCWLKTSTDGTVRSEKRVARKAKPGWCFGNSV